MTGCRISHRIQIYTVIKKLQLNAYWSSVQNSVQTHHCTLLFILCSNQQEIINDPWLCTFAPDISGLHDHHTALHLDDTDVAIFSNILINGSFNRA
jgi:hypothetical protein